MNVSSQHISEYLSQNKTVSLEKIGTFDLNQKEEKDIFTYDKHAATSPEFIQYLIESLNKPFSIVSQDLEYFLDQSRQLMNIRASSMMIDGIGYVYANNNGEYSFSSESAEATKEADKKTFDDVYTRNPLTSSVNYSVKRRSRKAPWRWIAFVLILGGIIAYAAYYVHSSPSFFFNDTHDSTTVKTAVSRESPAGNTNDAQSKTSVAKTKGFKFVIQTFPDESSCQKREQQLRNYGNIVSRDTSSSGGQPIYRLYVKDTLATAADTARIKDSLSAYFGHPVSVQ